MSKPPIVYEAKMWIAYFRSDPWLRLSIWTLEDQNFAHGTIYVLTFAGNQTILEEENIYDAILYAEEVWQGLKTQKQE